MYLFCSAILTALKGHDWAVIFEPDNRHVQKDLPERHGNAVLVLSYLLRNLRGQEDTIRSSPKDESALWF